MSLAFSGSTPIRPAVANINPNPLDIIVQNAGRKLMGLQMTRFCGEADKGDAQALTRDLLDIARIVDAALYDIGREAKAHIGHDVDLSLFTDQLLGAIEGNATHTICAAIENREDEIEATIGDARYALAHEAA